MSNRKGRASFLRPLTQIAPLSSNEVDPRPTSKASIASASEGPRPRSKSLASKDGVAVQVGQATPTSSIGGRGTLAVSRSNNRSSSFALNAPGHRRPSMSAREPTSVSRRGSMWSSFGDEGITSSAEPTDEEKAEATRKAFSNSIKVLWESGVENIITDMWASMSKGWKSGDVVGILSIDKLGLSRVEHARAVVLADDLGSQLQDLAAASLSIPGALKALQSGNFELMEMTLAPLVSSPKHASLLIIALDTFSKLVLRTLPSLISHYEFPESLNSAFFSLINLVTFLAGSSTDLRRAFVGFFILGDEAMSSLSSVARAVISIAASASSPVEQLVELRAHIVNLLAQPAFTNKLAVFNSELNSTWNGLVGNARVARASRGASRIWYNPALSLRERLAGILGALDAVGWEIPPIARETEDFSYTFKSLKPSFSALLPADVAFTYGSGSEGAPSTVLLRGQRFLVNGATYEITKRGSILGFTDSGTANVEVAFDIEVDLVSPPVGLSVTVRSARRPIVQLESAVSSAPVSKVWNAWLGTVVQSQIAEHLESNITETINAWLAPLFAESSVSAPGVTSVIEKQSTGSVAAVASVPGSPESTKTPAAPVGPPVGARAAFLASLRMTSGTSVRPLATGRDVLESLANPFASGPPSAVGVFDDNDHEEDDDSIGAGAGAGTGVGGRRMSMAMSLTDIAKSDTTRMDNITNPPRSRSLSRIVIDDQPTLFSEQSQRRLSLAYTPAGEPSLDAYDEEYAADAIDSYEAAAAGDPPATLTPMAQSLDERAEADGTKIEEHIASANARRAKAGHGFDGNDVHATRANQSMTRVTMDLQGHKAPLYDVEPKRTRPQQQHYEPTLDDLDWYASAPQQPAIRRKSMSEYLTELAMTDNTDPTANPGERRRTAANNDAPADTRPPMSSVLDAISSVDTTLPENIASPPRSRASSFAQNASTSFRPRTKSFIALTDLPTMSELGVDERISRDETEVTNSGTRRRSTAEQDAYAGIDPSELKKRRMSSFMTDATNVDATLLGNIQNPSSVDQTYHAVAASPHSLAARRQSMASS